ncbi:MAG: peptide-methionine (S)-S-oxide reductase MsrA [Candidatus Bathyarchaeota archaeon]|nr:peptide-methionine (S)-S-oxide reductase MsrA [Candidatus Bathyarchaeota archaeon]
MTQTNKLEAITLGGGCFWCTEAVFTRVKGVRRVVPGYSGGQTMNPTYAQISRGNTGYAEVILVTFNPGELSLTDLLEIFFVTHDPTTLNRQGADVGTQYRSVVFFHTDKQKAIINSVIAQLSAKNLWDKPIITQVEPLQTFYKAEEYHVEYFARHRKQPYCQLVIAPKLDKLRAKFRDKLKN